MLLMDTYLYSKSIKKYMEIINTEFQIVFISRKGGKQEERTLGQGGLQKEFPMYLIHFQCVHALYKANKAMFNIC